MNPKIKRKIKIKEIMNKLNISTDDISQVNIRIYNDNVSLLNQAVIANYLDKTDRLEKFKKMLENAGYSELYDFDDIEENTGFSKDDLLFTETDNTENDPTSINLVDIYYDIYEVKDASKKLLIINISDTEDCFYKFFNCYHEIKSDVDSITSNSINAKIDFIDKSSIEFELKYFYDNCDILYCFSKDNNSLSRRFEKLIDVIKYEIVNGTIIISFKDLIDVITQK